MCNKKLLVIYNAPNAPDYVETIAYPSNFLHLTGVKLNGNISAEKFYIDACERKLKKSNFEFKDNTTEQKLNVLIQTLRISTNAKMIGDFINGHLKLQTNKLAGSVNSCLGFIKTNNYYVPNTVLDVDIRQETSDRQKVLAILSKKVAEDKYNKIEMVGKKIDINRLLKKISPVVEIDSKIMGDIEYNSSQIQQQQSDNIKQIKFESPPQNILHSNSGAAVAIQPVPNPFKDLIDRLKNFFKKQDKSPDPTVQVDDQSEFIKNEIIEKNKVSSKLDELIEAREAFAEEKITMAEYKQALEKYMRSLNGKEMWTEAANNLRKQFEECPDNLKKCIDFELGSIELNIKRKFPQKQTLDEIKGAAHKQYIKQQNEKGSTEKETTVVKSTHER